jgi:hypothetical protein
MHVLYGFGACLYEYLENPVMLIMKKCEELYSAYQNRRKTHYFTTTDPNPFGYAEELYIVKIDGLKTGMTF